LNKTNKLKKLKPSSFVYSQLVQAINAIKLRNIVRLCVNFTDNHF